MHVDGCRALSPRVPPCHARPPPPPPAQATHSSETLATLANSAVQLGHPAEVMAAHSPLAAQRGASAMHDHCIATKMQSLHCNQNQHSWYRDQISTNWRTMAQVALKWVAVPLGSVRASLGHMSTFEDCYCLVDFIGRMYTDRPATAAAAAAAE